MFLWELKKKGLISSPKQYAGLNMNAQCEGMGEQRKGIPTKRQILTRQVGSQALTELVVPRLSLKQL